MKFLFFRISLLLSSILVLQACKGDDSTDYVPLNIIANADSGEVFQNAILEIAILANDTNVPQNGNITLTAPQSGTVLFVSIMSAIQCHPKLKPMYQRMVADGKPKKVALVACMRKQLTILNTMVKNGTYWDEKMA